MKDNEDPDQQGAPGRPRRLELGQRMKSRMRELRLSGPEVARHAAISAKQFNNYVNGQREPDLFSAARIAAALRMPLGDLVDPETMFSPRNDQAAGAMQRLRNAWPHLEGQEAALVADFANFLALARQDAAKGFYTFAGADEIRRQQARIHQQLIPSILGRFAPARLETFIHMPDDGQIWLGISLIYDERLDRTELASAIVSMALERLELTRTEACLLNRDEVTVTIGVRLGRAPRSQHVRHRDRPKARR